MKDLTLRRLVRGALIAALYVALTMLTQPISFGSLQVRIAEAMTLLPFLLPEAIPALTIGCLLSNILGGYGLPDIIFGTLATFMAAYLTSKIKIKWLAALPPVLLNAIIVGAVITYGSGLSVAQYPFTMLTVGIGEAIACYVFGVPLLVFIEKSKIHKFFK